MSGTIEVSLIMTSSEIADLIEELQTGIAAWYMMLPILNDSSVHDFLRSKGFDDGSTISLGRKMGPAYAGIGVHEAIRTVGGAPIHNLNFLKVQLVTAVSWIGNELVANGYYGSTQELEFFRHVRNGLAHNNKFHFENGQPKQVARFNTFNITDALQGQTVAFDYMNTGDFFDLFDHIKTYLRALP